MTAKKEPEDRRAAGHWLREQRRRHGYKTVEAFARALGVNPSRVSIYETGQAAVPDERASQIADLFRMDEITVRRELLLWVPKDPTPAPDPLPSPHRSLSEEERDRWVEAMRNDPELAKEFADLVAHALGRLAERDKSGHPGEPEEERPDSDNGPDLIADSNKNNDAA